MPIDQPGFAEIRDSLLELRDYRRKYAGYETLYSGEVPEYIVNTRIREDIREASRKYRLNFSRKCVQEPTQRTVISGIACDDEYAKAVLEQVWEDNQLDLDSASTSQKSYLFGNSVIIALPDDTLPGGISAYVHAPENVIVVYRQDRPREKSHAVHVYEQYNSGPLGDTKTTVAVTYWPDVIQRWESNPYSETTNYRYGDWENMSFHLVEEAPEPLPGIVPVFHFRTSREDTTGLSCLADVEGCQLALNDVFIALMSSIRSAGFQQRYLISEKQGSSGDNFSETSDDEEDLEEQQFQAGPDEILHFSGHGVQVGSFNVSESMNFLEPMDRLITYMARLANIPTSALLDSSNNLSGVALRRSERPIEQFVAYAKKLFGTTWSEFFSYVLQLKGISGIKASVIWHADVQDDEDFWTTQETKVAMGVPKSVALQEGGYTDDQTDQWNVDNELGEPVSQPVPSTQIPVAQMTDTEIAGMMDLTGEEGL